MTAYDEQEELEKLKAWWKNYGSSAIVGILLGAAVLVGFRYWTQYKEQRLHDASALYNQLVQDMRGKNADAARKAGETLVNTFSATPYAGMAGLLLARMDFEAGDVKTARTHLQWVIDNANEPATVSAARLRLAIGLSLGLIAVLAPWLLRNQMTFGGFFLSHTYDDNLARVSAVATLAEVSHENVQPWSPRWEDSWRCTGC